MRSIYLTLSERARELYVMFLLDDFAVRRIAYGLAHPLSKGKQRGYTIICKFCGEPFFSERQDRTYCSHSCRAHATHAKAAAAGAGR